MTKVALITGITGQDGSYLAEHLLNQGYIVHGIKRRSSQLNTQRIDHIYQDRHADNVKLFLHYGDLTDCSSLLSIMAQAKPDEVYNLGAMSHVHVSFEMPSYTTNVVAMGTINLLEIIKSQDRPIRFYQASTSELYGNSASGPQNEDTPFSPESPYAIAKHFAYSITHNYRKAYGLYACNGILFNHESPRRGETFLTRKVSLAVANIVLNRQQVLLLGNLDAERDWGHARDYVKAMHLMLQQQTAEDYVIATGTTTKVREFARQAFAVCGLTLHFEGSGVDEAAYIEQIDHDQFANVVGQSAAHLSVGQKIIQVHQEYFRPVEVHRLLGDASKAKRQLGWQAETSLSQLIEEMVLSDIAAIKQNHHG